MNLANITEAIQNVKAHPYTTVSSALLATALALSHQPSFQNLLTAFLVALVGALAKDPVGN